jgi:hypothetical protein
VFSVVERFNIKKHVRRRRNISYRPGYRNRFRRYILWKITARKCTLVRSLLRCGINARTVIRRVSSKLSVSDLTLDLETRNNSETTSYFNEIP